MANLEVRTYTPRQAEALYQFRRADALLNQLNTHEDKIARGIKMLMTDRRTQESRVFGYWEVRMLRGALFGMYNEAVSLGLREEITK